MHAAAAVLSREPAPLDRANSYIAVMIDDLTLHGVTKPVTFNVTFVGTGRSPLPPFKVAAGFTATTTIKRSDFGSDFLNNGIVGDDVSLTIEAEFDRK